MFIRKIEIWNVLGVESANLLFSNDSSTYIVQCEKNCAIRSSFSTAVELIFSAKYATLKSLINPKDIQKGFVRITFAVPRKNGKPAQDTEITTEVDPCTSSAAAAGGHVNQSQCEALHSVHQIVACRDFRLNPEVIIYSVDEAPNKLCSPAAFHGKFSTDPSFVFSHLEKMRENTRSGNLLKCVVEHLHYNWSQDQQAFYHLTNCLQNATSKRAAFLSKHTTYFINTILANNAVVKLNIFKICQDIRIIFEYVTCQEYTVWFFIPCQGKYIEMNKIISENLDIDAIETCIQLKNCKTPRLIHWEEGDEGIKDLLLITLDLAVSFHCKTNLIFIKQTDAIEEYQAMKLSTAAYLQKFNEIETISWITKNYLQRIIDVCNTIKAAAVIEYVGGLPVPPINAHIIKCFNQPPFMTVFNPEPYDIDTLIKRLNENLV